MEEVQPWKARLLLIAGGIFGIHRLYIRQFPEAFVFFSTAGVFLLGCLYDSFVFRFDVEAYNLQCLENEEKDYRKPRQKTLINYSLTRFLYSVLYGTWIGILAWLACSVTFGWSDINHVPFIFVLAVGVSAGVYIIGQCGGQSRELSYIWISAFSAIFILIRLAQCQVFKALFFTSIISTVIANRSVKIRKRALTWKHFLFWVSLFLMLVCVIVLGCSRKIMDKQITATRPGNFRETSSIGSLLRDRFFDPKKVHEFFKTSPIIEYNKSNNEKMRTKNEKVKKENGLWDRIWSGEMFDDFTGAAHLTKIDWIELFTVFIVDILRAETKVVENPKSPIEPLQWAAWRNYLIHKFSLKPLVNDEKIKSSCKSWSQQNPTIKKERESKDFAAKATRKACKVFNDL
ncbi:unnamed protein product [Caenorhabditis angaria]|uniref:TM2 domain-containing protein n=1 Tax=Caenorhabditis angaria TaxID=860376 RepID=A0A9P1I163_9PELO|nr:unnamed protein product [Caenorhabditis angaria]